MNWREALRAVVADCRARQTSAQNDIKVFKLKGEEKAFKDGAAWAYDVIATEFEYLSQDTVTGSYPTSAELLEQLRKKLKNYKKVQ